MFDLISQFYIEHKLVISYVSIPFVSGFVGWFTNMVALKMTFYPLRFKGIPGFWKIPPFIGWQGIIPRKAGKMASVSVDIITTQLIPVEEIYSRLDPKEIARELDPIMKDLGAEIVDEVAKITNASLWSATPKLVREQIVNQVNREAPEMVKSVLLDLKANLYKIFDVKGLVVKALTGRNVKRMVDMFQKVGGPEFTFIEMSGLYFGFILGIFQMGIFYVVDAGWTLPVAGIIVGYITNWLALRMIFRPMYETRYAGIPYQGLFHKRQDSVSKEYANLVATEILSSRQIVNHILFGPTADIFFSIIIKNVGRFIDSSMDVSKPAIALVIGDHKFDDIRQRIIDKIGQSVPKSARHLEEYMDSALDLNETMYNRLRELSPPEFEKILRTAFQEDEILLILVGAVLGAIAGGLQWMAFFT